MQHIFIMISMVLQLFYLAALSWFFKGVAVVWEFYRHLDAIEPSMRADVLSGVFSKHVLFSILFSLPALAGVVLSLALVYTLKKPPIYFIKATQMVSYLWLFFLPVGTVLGAIQLMKIKKIRNRWE